MKKMTRKRKVFLAILLGVIICIGAFCFFAFRDEPPFDDSDLQLTWLDIPDEENALTYFMKAADELLADEKEYRAFTDQTSKGIVYDPSLCEDFLKKHKEGFEILNRGLECGRMQLPKRKYIVIPHNILRINSCLRDIADILSTKSYHQSKQKHYLEAINTAIDALRIANMIENGKASFEQFLSGTTIRRLSLERINSLLYEEGITKEVLT